MHPFFAVFISQEESSCSRECSDHSWAQSIVQSQETLLLVDPAHHDQHGGGGS